MGRGGGKVYCDCHPPTEKRQRAATLEDNTYTDMTDIYTPLLLSPVHSQKLSTTTLDLKRCHISKPAVYCAEQHYPLADLWKNNKYTTLIQAVSAGSLEIPTLSLLSLFTDAALSSPESVIDDCCVQDDMKGKSLHTLDQIVTMSNF